jgi:hypothetical protein
MGHDLREAVTSHTRACQVEPHDFYLSLRLRDLNRFTSMLYWPAANQASIRALSESTRSRLCFLHRQEHGLPKSHNLSCRKMEIL